MQRYLTPSPTQCAYWKTYTFPRSRNEHTTESCVLNHMNTQFSPVLLLLSTSRLLLLCANIHLLQMCMIHSLSLSLTRYNLLTFFSLLLATKKINCQQIVAHWIQNINAAHCVRRCRRQCRCHCCCHHHYIAWQCNKEIQSICWLLKCFAHFEKLIHSRRSLETISDYITDYT